MRKLRILGCEVIGLGILLGWLMWKYPELVDDIIPWVALLVAWHLTWEFILDTKCAKRKAIAVGKRGNHVAVWVLVFLIGGGTSLLYWAGINKSLQRLASFAEKRAAAKLAAVRSSSPSPTTPSAPAPHAQQSQKATPAITPTQLQKMLNDALGKQGQDLSAIPNQRLSEMLMSSSDELMHVSPVWKSRLETEHATGDAKAKIDSDVRAESKDMIERACRLRDAVLKQHRIIGPRTSNVYQNGPHDALFIRLNAGTYSSQDVAWAARIMEGYSKRVK